MEKLLYGTKRTAHLPLYNGIHKGSCTSFENILWQNGWWSKTPGLDKNYDEQMRTTVVNDKKNGINLQGEIATVLPAPLTDSFSEALSNRGKSTVQLEWSFLHSHLERSGSIEQVVLILRKTFYLLSRWQIRCLCTYIYSCQNKIRIISRGFKEVWRRTCADEINYRSWTSNSGADM